jgi:superfamily II DNA or RNA helicase
MAAKHPQASMLISRGVFNGVKSFREFEQRVSSLFELNTKAQGDAFEIFVEAYLATQPIIQSQESWPVGFIPSDVRLALNLPKDSKGIDGVYKSNLDCYVPYQVKFRTNRPALGFNEVAPFLGITEKATDRLLITNCDAIAIDVQNRTGIRSLRGVDFDQLTEKDFTQIETWLKNKPAQRQSISPDPHQLEALSNISRHLESNNRGTVVMACGTGKTLVALWAAEHSRSKTILVLVPSLTLMQQTLEEWSIHNSWGKDYSYLCVCSDPSVNLKNDELEINPSDVPFRIDTDPVVVRRYLGQDNGKNKIVFSTYQSSLVISQATQGEFEFDIGIFDEAHKTTGYVTGKFALALKDEHIKIKKRLFFTATPKHYDITKRDKDGEFKIVSMDDEKVYGSYAHTLTFGEAASKGIICPYKVVISLIDKNQVDFYSLKNGVTFIDNDTVKAKWAASQLAIASAIKHTNSRKIITFHSRVKSAQDFASNESYGINKFLIDYDVFHVNGKQKVNERKHTISKFKKANRSLITNAKCLTEGVDVPAVDMVAFVDPRRSKIDIAQAVGRAMRKPRDGNKKVGYIVVPIYAKDASKQSLEEAIDREGFDDVALVLNALLEQDEELAEIVRELKQAKGKGDIFNPKRFKDKVEFIGPLIQLDELANSIYVQALDRLGETWDEWYGRLIKFKNNTGHCLVPNEYLQDGHKLGYWVARQRAKKNKLKIEHIKKLEEIGFVWDAISQKWEDGFDCLQNFKKNHNHCLVSSFEIFEGFELGTWVRVQRMSKEIISNDRLNKLNEIGFVWNTLEDKWDKNFEALRQFKNREGHCKVPSKHKEAGLELGRWVIGQRVNKMELNSKRLAKLNDLGFVWDALEDAWDAGFAALNRFIEREGHCFVPKRYVEDGYRLGLWLNTQRVTKELLPEDRVKKLDSINIVWDVLGEKWEDGFRSLLNFRNREGSCDVQQKHIESGFNLGQWVAAQRKRKSQGKLLEQRVVRLNEIDFIWDLFEMQWDKNYLLLINFKEREGNCRVPKRHVEDGIRLGQWVLDQRKNKDELTLVRKGKLNNIGFIWDVNSDDWERGYEALVMFLRRSKHFRVPIQHIENGHNLGQWAHYQRINKNNLPEDRIIRLVKLGFFDL